MFFLDRGICFFGWYKFSMGNRKKGVFVLINFFLPAHFFRSEVNIIISYNTLINYER